jgi:hypothetical protein
MHAVWKEDSVCSDRFSVERVLLESKLEWRRFSTSALYDSSTAPFHYSNFVEQGVRSGKFRSKAVVTDYFSTASLCNEVSS